MLISVRSKPTLGNGRDTAVPAIPETVQEIVSFNVENRTVSIPSLPAEHSGLV